MAIYFVQHGEALPKDVDSERGLSEIGRKNCEKVSAYLAEMEISINKICHSGKKRALQTAEIFAEALGNCEISETDGMGPNDDVAHFSEIITDDTMYVGHLPHLGKLVSLLLTGNENSDVVAVSNSGVICIDKCETGNKVSGFKLIWHLPAFLLG